MKTLKILTLVVLTCLLALGVHFARSGGAPPPRGSESERRIEPGPYVVTTVSGSLVDDSRSTPASGEFGGAPERKFDYRLWYPEGDTGGHPLLVYSHGFMGNLDGGRYLAEHMASYGYVVIAANFPSSTRTAPGGAILSGVKDQPEDVSFLIDTVLGWSEEERPFEGQINPQQIGAFGLSLGGFTTTLVAFHATLRDPRIKAAISMAGPTAMMTSKFFSTSNIPFLYIAGTSDLLIDYEIHARRVPDVVPSGEMLTLDGGSHLGFVDASSGPMRLLSNPDELACFFGMNTEMPEPGDNPFALLGGQEVGMTTGEGIPYPCQLEPVPAAIKPGRQQMITIASTRAFFEGQFADDSDSRAGHRHFISQTLSQDFPEVHWHPSRAGTSMASAIQR